MESLLSQQDRYLCPSAFQSGPVCARVLAWLSCCVRVHSLLLALSFYAGQAIENFYEQVLVVLHLSCYRRRRDSEAMASPVNDPKLRMVIWLKPGVVPPPTPTGPVKRDWFTLMGAFASAFAAPTCMGDHESLEAG